jgi:hypothetical protein
VISAVAPAGVLAMEIFSVVPRVTDAQPTHGSAIAAARTSLNILKSAPCPTEISNNHREKSRGVAP